ncbi:MAG: hypothetical protein JWM10_758 [Myxococcaceae bacterium]|nr:hypothetical protein [Myxococcaceae bacterium]
MRRVLGSQDVPVVLISLLFATLVIAMIGRVLVGLLGWPTSRGAALRWCYALLVVAVIFCGLPEILRAATRATAPLPPVDLAELVPVLLMLGLAVLGYTGWQRGVETRAEEERRDAQASTQVRRRALPPPPAQDGTDEPAGTGFRPRGRVEAPAAEAPTEPEA